MCRGCTRSAGATACRSAKASSTPTTGSSPTTPPPEACRLALRRRLYRLQDRLLRNEVVLFLPPDPPRPQAPPAGDAFLSREKSYETIESGRSRTRDVDRAAAGARHD